MEYLSKSDMVARQIRELITSGELEPGAVLRQRDLADRFGVSPTPVREALRRLEAEGFINSELHRGSTVVRTEQARLHENFMIRASLESLAARLAASNATDDDLAEVAEIHDRLERCDPEDPALAELNHRFHFRIYECTRSPVLLSLLNLLWRSLPGGPQIFRKHEQSRMHHIAILNALRARDADAAAEHTRTHIMAGSKLIPHGIDSAETIEDRHASHEEAGHQPV